MPFKTILAAVLLYLNFPVSSSAQPNSKTDYLDSVLSTSHNGFAELRGSLDSTKLPDTVYHSMVTVEGTKGNYLRIIGDNTQGYFALLGQGLSFVQAKALVQKWRGVIQKALAKHTREGDKVSSTHLPGSGYLFVKPSPSATLQVFVLYYKQDKGSKYDAVLNFLVSQR